MSGQIVSQHHFHANYISLLAIPWISDYQRNVFRQLPLVMPEKALIEAKESATKIYTAEGIPTIRKYILCQITDKLANPTLSL